MMGTTWHHKNQIHFLKDCFRKQRNLSWFLYQGTVWFTYDNTIYKPIRPEELMLDLKKVNAMVPKSPTPDWVKLKYGYEDAKAVEVHGTNLGFNVIELQSEHHKAYIDAYSFTRYFDLYSQFQIRGSDDMVRVMAMKQKMVVGMVKPVIVGGDSNEQT